MIRTQGSVCTSFGPHWSLLGSVGNLWSWVPPKTGLIGLGSPGISFPSAPGDSDVSGAENFGSKAVSTDVGVKTGQIQVPPPVSWVAFDPLAA